MNRKEFLKPSVYTNDDLCDLRGLGGSKKVGGADTSPLMAVCRSSPAKKNRDNQRDGHKGVCGQVPDHVRAHSRNRYLLGRVLDRPLNRLRQQQRRQHRDQARAAQEEQGDGADAQRGDQRAHTGDPLIYRHHRDNHGKSTSTFSR